MVSAVTRAKVLTSGIVVVDFVIANQMRLTQALNDRPVAEIINVVNIQAQLDVA